MAEGALVASRLSHLECARCGARRDPELLHNRCDCGGPLLAAYDLSGVALDAVRARPPGMWRYRELLPVRGEPVSFGETETPLIFLPRLSERWGVEVWLKDDSGLAGGTFKARGAAAGISRVRELGAEAVVLPSAGNAGGAWALYGARAGIGVTVTMARSAPAFNRAEVRIASATLELVDGTVADAGERAREIASGRGAFLAATFSEPYRVEGKKTAWLEVFDRFGDRERMRFPASLVMPVGGGVAALAAAKAAREVAALGWAAGDAPRILGVQSRTCAPIVAAFVAKRDTVEPWIGEIATAAAGLRVPAPSEGTLVLNEVRASKGAMLAVTEEEIEEATVTLATTEGVWACPEGAAAVAGAARLAGRGELPGPAVIYNTGSGAKYAQGV